MNTPAFSFALLADVHIGWLYAVRQAGFASPECMDNTALRKAVEMINIIKPGFAVFCGDMVCFGRETLLIRRFKESIADICCPVHYICGNHDILMSPDEIGIYRSAFGLEYGMWEKDSSLFISLNTCCMEKYFIDRSEARRQLLWLEEALQASESKEYLHKFVICHVPFFVYSPDEEDNGFGVLSEFRHPFLELLEKYGVEFVLSGHTHKEFDVTYKGTRHLTSSTLMWPAEGMDYAGFRLFHVYPERVDTQWIRLKDGLSGIIR